MTIFYFPFMTVTRILVESLVLSIENVVSKPTRIPKKYVETEFFAINGNSFDVRVNMLHRLSNEAFLFIGIHSFFFIAQC